MAASIVESLLAHAAERPGATALVCRGERVAYAEFARLVTGFARYLLSAGLPRGGRVVMQSEQSIAYAVCHMGTHLAGGAFVPAERSASLEAVSEMAEVVDAHRVISGKGADFLAPDRMLELARAHAQDDVPLPLPGENEPAEILFTTGTTGKSKGVLCSHRSVVGVAENLVYGMEYGPDTLIAVPGPLNHANAIRKLSAAWLAGTGVLILDGVSNLGAFFQALDSWPVTALCLPPAAIRTILALSGDKLGNYRDRIDFVESGTASLPEADKRRMCELLPHSRLYNSYGTSEAGSSCMFDYSAMRDLKGCIGKPAVNAAFVIVDERGDVMESGPDRPGLIAYGGKMLMTGYWNEPALTAQAVRDGRVVTSDLGYIEDGLVYIIGRAGDVINVGGFKVAPDEVEQAALQVPGVRECGCRGVPDKMSGEAVALYVVMDEGAAFDAAEIRRRLRAALADYQVPKVIFERNELPRASNGKLQRKLL